MSWMNYRDLVVWQKAMDLADAVYEVLNFLPAEEIYALGTQMRRAAVSVPSNIAEGRGRQTTKDLKGFLAIARGSCYELETQLIICLRRGYLTKLQVQRVLSLCDEVGRMLTGMITSDKVETIRK